MAEISIQMNFMKGSLPKVRKTDGAAIAFINAFLIFNVTNGTPKNTTKSAGGKTMNYMDMPFSSVKINEKLKAYSIAVSGKSTLAPLESEVNPDSHMTGAVGTKKVGNILSMGLDTNMAMQGVCESAGKPNQRR